jgi:hypothetical protein
MTSDTTGEIYVVTKSDGNPVNGLTPATNPSSASPSPSPTRSAAMTGAHLGLWLFVAAVVSAFGNAMM